MVSINATGIHLEVCNGKKIVIKHSALVLATDTWSPTP